MRVRLWGTRGSIATPGPSTVRYGGNTACVEVRSRAGTVLVVDCGTGARLLGAALMAEATARDEPTRGALLIGHTHWDHIQGLPFFAPLFQPGAEWAVYGPRGLGQSLAATLAGQMHYQYFPVTLDDLHARVTYHDLVEGDFEVADLRITAQYLNHPALTLGYRVEGDGVSVAYVCDHEPFDPSLAEGGDVVASAPDARHVAFLSGADLVVHDAQYLASEYDAKRGWGHSTVEYAVDVAAAAGVGELLLTHHDPLRTDDALDSMQREARRRARARGFLGVVGVAAEGDARDLAPSASGRAGSRAVQSAEYVPAQRDLEAHVVLTVEDDLVGRAVQAAAEAEHLPIVLDRELRLLHADAVVVVDHDQDGVLLHRLAELSEDQAWSRMSVLAVTRTHPGSGVGGVVSDWLVWPTGVGHLRTKLRAAVLRRACRWQCAPLPPDEPERLRALHALGLLDTPPEERFDRLTRQACEVLGVTMALVSLVDAERQWFKSRRGLEDQESPREESLCAHAILDDDVMQVPDLLEDDRFADSPATGAPHHIRFYAGAPLVLSDGSRVGTLCVADRAPRALDDSEVEALRALAVQVVRELEASQPVR